MKKKATSKLQFHFFRNDLDATNERRRHYWNRIVQSWNQLWYYIRNSNGPGEATENLASLPFCLGVFAGDGRDGLCPTKWRNILEVVLRIYGVPAPLYRLIASFSNQRIR